MRILYVGRNARIGGGTTFRLNISRGLIARGHQTWVASFGGEMVRRFREHGIGYVWTPPAPTGGRWIERAIRRHGIDLVHASNTTPGTAAGWACARTGVPLVMSIHGLLGKRDHLQPCLQQARRIISFEEVAVDRLARRGTVDMGKVTLLRRPIEHRPELPPDGSPFRVVAVSRLSRRKGQNVLELIRGFRLLLRKFPKSTLSILGEGTLLGTVRRAARGCNLLEGRPVVEVLGSVADPVPIIGNAHVLVGASYCALEAIMQGVAVIGAGFWGYGPIDEDNLRDAMAWNFGDVGGQWTMDARNFGDALQTLHDQWSAGVARERFWRLDRLIEEDHALERVAQRLEVVYQDVLTEAIRSPVAPGGPGV